MILDTEFLGSLIEQHPDARQKAGKLDAEDVPVRVPSLVVWEIYYGVSNSTVKNRETLRTGYEKLLQSVPVVDLSEELARRAGEIRGRHSRSDSIPNLDGADSAVAATAISYGEPVLSNNQDFQDVDGLDVVTY